MGLAITILVILVIGMCEYIRYALKLYKLVQSMKVGQIWREYESKEPENPWGEREYTDYEIMDIKTSKKGNLWIRCKIVNTDTFHRPFIGSEHSYKAYNFIYVKEPVLIKNIE